MQYRINPKNGDRLSALGYGCLRLPAKGPRIDQQKAEEAMELAIRQGVNYFDTAYTYPGSEEALGKFLAKGHRKDVFLATKLPHYLVKKPSDIERIFREELKRLQTDHIDYYLMHMLTDLGGWQRMKDLGIEKWIEEKKASGQIRNIGFSFHGGTGEFLDILNAYDWDFCQIQYNYMDENTQAGRRGLLAAAEKGIPVIIMEPLRGGRLVQGLPGEARKVMESCSPKRSPAEWGLRWLWDQPQVTVVLSGMNSTEQVEENTRIAADAAPGCLTETDRELIERVKEEIRKKVKVGCTGCGYCMPCPHGVNIPVCFSCYNTRYTDSWFTGMREYFMTTTLRKKPSNASLCRKCGLCEKKCPQHVPIREKLEEVRRGMEGPVYKIARKVAGIVSRFQ